jgi:osmotically-inducible protein OsmY
MKTDSELKDDVIGELACDAAIEPDSVGVIVDRGVVTLTGHVKTFGEKNAIERAVGRVAGVRGIALELDVKLSVHHHRSDSEIAQAAASALRWNSAIPNESVQVKVENGWITLTGEVIWFYQSEIADQCVRHIVGTRGITNNIEIKSSSSSTDISADISAAFKRQAAREAKHIDIKVHGSVVTLHGSVHSLAERNAALGVAFTSRGVSKVVDRLEIVD